MNGKALEEVDQFKYLGSIQTKDGSSITEAKVRLAQAYSAITKLATLWKNKAINFPPKIELYKSFVMSIYWSGESKLQEDAWHIGQR